MLSERQNSDSTSVLCRMSHSKDCGGSNFATFLVSVGAIECSANYRTLTLQAFSAECHTARIVAEVEPQPVITESRLAVNSGDPMEDSSGVHLSGVLKTTCNMPAHVQ